MITPHEERGQEPTLERLRELTRNIEAITESFRELRKSQRETSEQMQETDRQMQETDRRLKKAEDLFTTQWGKLMQSLVRGDLVRLLDGRGIGVRSLAQQTLARRGGESYEVDILAVNGEEIVVVEVKTTPSAGGRQVVPVQAGPVQGVVARVPRPHGLRRDGLSSRRRTG